MANMPGGWSKTMAASEEIQKICDKVKCRVEERTKKNYREFKAINYKEQIVEGTNFIIEVDVGEQRNIQLSIFQALPCHGGEIKLLSVQ